jgi:hypothetical protein
LIDFHQTGVRLQGSKSQEPECKSFNFTIAMWEVVKFLNEIVLKGFIGEKNQRNLVEKFLYLFLVNSQKYKKMMKICSSHMVYN